MDNPKTSIVVTTHNYAQYLEECVNSLLSQTVKSLEIIVVDDASSDFPENAMEKYKSNEIVQFHSVNFKNAQNSRNFGFKKATGEYLLFLDADDYLRKDFLEKTQYILHSNLEIDCVYSDRTNFGSAGALEKIGQKKEWKTNDYSYSELKKHNYISLPALVRREKFTGFDEKINRFQDWDAWLTYLKGKKAYHISEPLFYVRFHGKNKSFATNKYTEKLKVQMKHKLITSDSANYTKENQLVKKKNIVIIVGNKDDYSSVISYIEKLSSNKNEIHIFFSNFDKEKYFNLPREIAKKLIFLKISYRIARRYNSDEVCNSFRDGHFVSPYNVDYLIILGAIAENGRVYVMPVKFRTDLLWNSDSDSFSDIKSLDEANWIFNKKGIKKFFNL